MLILPPQHGGNMKVAVSVFAVAEEIACLRARYII